VFGGNAIMIVGTVIQASAYSVAQMIVGRIVGGFGIGLITSTVAAWQSETSSAKDRGRLVSVEGFFIIVGREPSGMNVRH
jgi:MFS family permease